MSDAGYYHEGNRAYQPPPAEQAYDPPAPPNDAALDGQAAYAQHKEPDSYDLRDERRGDQPPPRSRYPTSGIGRYRSYERNRALPRPNRDGRSDAEYEYFDGPPMNGVGTGAPGERPFAPEEPRPHEGNQLACYDEEKAYAEYHSAYGSEGYGPAPPAPEYGRAYDDRRHVPQQRYSEEQGARRYDSRSSHDDRDRNISRYSRHSTYDDRPRPRDRPSMPPPLRASTDIFGQGDGKRGLGAALLGGAAGAILGNEAGRGALGTLGGIAVGAIGANALEKHFEQRKEGRDMEARRRYQGSYEAGGSDPYYGSRGPSRRDHGEERSESIRDMREHRQRKRAYSSEDSWTSDE